MRAWNLPSLQIPDGLNSPGMSVKSAHGGKGSAHPLRPTQRPSLRKSMGFIDIEEIFAEIEQG